MAAWVQNTVRLSSGTRESRGTRREPVTPAMRKEVEKRLVTTRARKVNQGKYPPPQAKPGIVSLEAWRKERRKEQDLRFSHHE
jgi:hypothetical protein